MTPTTPKRRIRLKLDLGADSWTELCQALDEIGNHCFRVAENDDGTPTRCTSGGVGSGWHLDIDIDATKTAETYRAELAAWMASNRETKDGAQ